MKQSNKNLISSPPPFPCPTPLKDFRPSSCRDIKVATHPDICTVFNLLCLCVIPWHSIGNCGIITDFYQLVTHIIKIAAHYKHAFSDFISTPAITLDEIVKWDISTEPLLYRFGNNVIWAPYGISAINKSSIFLSINSEGWLDIRTQILQYGLYFSPSQGEITQL